MGQKQTFTALSTMSALPPKTDMDQSTPESAKCHKPTSRQLFDHFVGLRKQCWWDSEA